MAKVPKPKLALVKAHVHKWGRVEPRHGAWARYCACGSFIVTQEYPGDHVTAERSDA